MTNPYLLFSGIGMILVGILPVVYWRKDVELKYFLFGALTWAAAIGVKVLMDLTPLNDFLMRKFTISTFIVIFGVYVGLRTGILENGFTYIASKKIEMNFKDAVGFGIGFGGSEAIFLGILSFLSVLNLILTKASTYEDPSILFPPIIERLFVLFSHIFSCVLVIYSVKTKKIRYFLYSIIYKSPIDGIIPWMQHNIPKTVKGTYMMEIPVVIFGIIGLIGIIKLREVME